MSLQDKTHHGIAIVTFFSMLRDKLQVYNDIYVSMSSRRMIFSFQAVVVNRNPYLSDQPG